MIQIVAVVWVLAETKYNWSGFLDFLLRYIEAPGFVISDRDKGLIPAMEVKAGDIPHCVFVTCSRIFNAKLRNATIENQAWNVAKSLTVASFKRRASELRKNCKSATMATRCKQVRMGCRV